MNYKIRKAKLEDIDNNLLNDEAISFYNKLGFKEQRIVLELGL